MLQILRRKKKKKVLYSCSSVMWSQKNPYSIKEMSHKPKLRDILKVICSSKMKSKGKLKKCSRLKTTKEAWQLDARCDPKDLFLMYSFIRSHLHTMKDTNWDNG